MQKGSPGRSNLISIRPRNSNTMISRGRTAFVSDNLGEAHKNHSGEGLYVYNTRVLSHYVWLIDGKKPEFTCGSEIEQFTWMGYLVQPPTNWKRTSPPERDALQQTLELRLKRSVGEGMHEDVQLTNHTQIETDVLLELKYEYAFEAREEAESSRKQHGELHLESHKVSEGVWEQVADYTAEHRYSHQGDRGVALLHRGLRLRIESSKSPPELKPDRLQFCIHLKPHQEWHACLSWIAYVDGQPLPIPAGCPGNGTRGWDGQRKALLNSISSFSTPHGDDLTALVDRVLQRSRLDLSDLRMYDLDSPGGVAISAGVPTYMEVFGRDLQAAAWQATLLGPEFLHGSINVLSDLQATATNDWRDAQPGRIPHEIHKDPLSVLNFRPQGLYFGDVTSSFLLPISVSELWHWTGDLDAIRGYAEACMDAIHWADTYCRDSTGFYRYQTHSTQGLKNQGWKDSSDAIVYPDGSQVPAPIGTSEMQAFVYAAKLHFSEVMFRLGHVAAARRLFVEAEDLKKRFNEKFWMEDEGYYAMGIDAKGEPIRSIASDAGHCLLAGIVDTSRIQPTACRLMRQDLFSGWGIRTLSADHRAFNPFAYHRGTVWPVTNAGFVMAFSRFGLHGEMHMLAKAIFEAASLFEHFRLPEVFGGHQRTSEAPFPGLYARAAWPQAWSASAPILILQALLGIYPYAPARLLFLDPHLPEWLPEITVERMRVGKASVTLTFTRNAEGRTDYTIDNLQGKLHIVRQPSPWSLTTGWAERTREIVESMLPHRQAS